MQTLEGIGVANGIAIGHALVLFDEDTVIFEESIAPEKTDDVIQTFLDALDEAKHQIEVIKNQVRDKIGEEHAFIFDAHIMFLDDHSLKNETISFIREKHCTADWAFNQVLLRLLSEFESLGDPYFVERAKDLEDVGKRVLRILLGSKRGTGFENLQKEIIVVGSEFGPSNITTFDHPMVQGFATDFGGQTTHTAIIAKALGLPAVLGLHYVTRFVKSGDLIILDSYKGRVILDPDEKTLKKYDRIAREHKREEEIYIRDVGEPAVSKDGIAVNLMANIELPTEVETALQYGAQGIGLYRTEFLFLEYAPKFPSEDDHYDTYCKIAKMMGDLPVTIRTLDLGGEKFFHRAFVKEKEVNPVLGLRGVRLCLMRKDIFRVQLKGLLRAAAEYENIRIMFPLITSVGELLEVKAFLKKVRDELKSEGHPIPKRIPIGIMIEVPSAAMVSDYLAYEVDFFSIGTNDLIQYLLAIDRSNDDVNYLYDPLHPGVLRLIQMVIDNARAAGIDVSCCGEVASSPIYASLLVSMGLTNLSMNPTSIPNIHHLIRLMDLKGFTKIAGTPDSRATGKQNLRRYKSAMAQLLPKKDYKNLVVGTKRKKRV